MSVHRDTAWFSFVPHHQVSVECTIVKPTTAICALTQKSFQGHCKMVSSALQKSQIKKYTN